MRCRQKAFEGCERLVIPFRSSDISISEDELRFVIGEHYYDPSVGGNTGSRIAFESVAGDASAEGGFEDWPSVAKNCCRRRGIGVEDYSDYELIEWTNH